MSADNYYAVVESVEFYPNGDTGYIVCELDLSGGRIRNIWFCARSRVKAIEFAEELSKTNPAEYGVQLM